ncbi:MAG: DUF1799 domain-containing protein [Vicinamibacterales bacterium]
MVREPAGSEAKKLVDAARWLYGGGPAYCRACRKTRGEDSQCEPCEKPEIWPEHQHALQVFVACQTQWRTGGLGGVIGLDYCAVAQVMRWQGVPVRRRADVWQDVQVLEAEALAVFREHQKSTQDRQGGAARL